MKIQRFFWMFVLLVPAYAQSWTSFSASELTYRQFPTGSAPPPGSWMKYQAFPSGNVGATDGSCPATNNPSVQYRRLSPYTQTNPYSVWGAVITGNFLRNPGSLYVSSYRSNIRGLRFEGAFGGRIDSNSDLTWNNLTQGVFYHQNYCYDGGPEFGFARTLIHVTGPLMTKELTTVHFYYSVHTNCDVARNLPTLPGLATETHAVCNWTTGGQITQQSYTSPDITIWHDTIYDYSAYLVNSSTFHIEVKRVGTTNCSDSGNTCADYPVMSWFNSDASSMLANSEAGFVTIALNKSLAADGAGTFYGRMTSPSWDLAAIGTNLLQYSY